MNTMTLKCVATGRKWGDKIDETQKKITIGGVPCLIVECDTWDGGCGQDGEVQQYFRWTLIQTENPVRRDDKA